MGRRLGQYSPFVESHDPDGHDYLAREARARVHIDKQLAAAGWKVQAIPPYRHPAHVRADPLPARDTSCQEGPVTRTDSLRTGHAVRCPHPPPLARRARGRELRSPCRTARHRLKAVRVHIADDPSAGCWPRVPVLVKDTALSLRAALSTAVQTVRATSPEPVTTAAPPRRECARRSLDPIPPPNRKDETMQDTVDQAHGAAPRTMAGIIQDARRTGSSGKVRSAPAA
jgi:hypothetical protein